MKISKRILAALLVIATVGAWAQVPLPQMVNNQTTKGRTTTQSETYHAGSMPYSSQTNYDGMGGIPQYRAESTNPSHIGVLGEKWETDKRGRRSTFIHDGKEVSIGYELQKNEPVNKTQSTGLDSLINRNAHLP